MAAYPCGGDVTCAHDGLGDWVTAGVTIGAASLALGISWEAAVVVCSLYPVGCMTAASIAVDNANGAPVNVATPAPAAANDLFGRTVETSGIVYNGIVKLGDMWIP